MEHITDYHTHRYYKIYRDGTINPQEANRGPTDAKFGTGDIVEMELNTDAKILKWYIHNKHIEGTEIKSIDFDNNEIYYLSVAMACDKVKIKLLQYITRPC